MIESGSVNSFEAIFDSAISFECKAAEVYEEFSKLFAHIQEISSFWREFVKDEIQHADTLQNICNSLTSEEFLSPCNEEISRKIDITHRMLNEVSIASIVNLDDAYELAHELEFSEVNAIFTLLTTKFFSSEECQEFIVSQITKHQQKLIDFTRNFGDRDWRKEITVKRA
jgi:rubrerythrin